MINNTGKHYLYRHIRLDTGEPFYIGIGKKATENHTSYDTEYKRALSKKDRNKFWSNLTSKTDYKVEILLESNDYEFIKQKEIEFVALYGRKNLGLGTLVNLTDGGDGTLGYKPPDEIRKLRAFNRKNLNEKKYASERLGEIHKNKQGFTVEIIEYFDSANCTVRFSDGKILKNVVYGNVKRGTVENPWFRKNRNGGYVGVGKYKSTTHMSIYQIWDRMTKNHNINLCKEWRNFQNFAKWYEDNYTTGFNFDKTMLSDNCEYSPKTCCFVPKEFSNITKEFKNKKQGISIGVRKQKSSYMAVFKVNGVATYFTGYKTDEDAHSKYIEIRQQSIKDSAEKWKDKISKEVYETLINHKITN